VTSVWITQHGFAADGATASWGRFAGAADPLAASATALLGALNPRLARLDRATLSALVAASLLLERGAHPAALFVAVEDGSASADRAFWATARIRGGADASPTLFAATLPSAVAGELAMTFGLRGPCVVTSGSGSFDAPRVFVPGIGAGTRLHVRMRGWETRDGGETHATLEWPPRAPPTR
jgi:hypothetical protein